MIPQGWIGCTHLRCMEAGAHCDVPVWAWGLEIYLKVLNFDWETRPPYGSKPFHIDGFAADKATAEAELAAARLKHELIPETKPETREGD